jgi:DNA-binding winged helix-turn-helix (wHTH) protein/Tol biopolymer transport system component
MNGQTRQVYAFGPFRFDPEERLLLRDGKAIPLAPKVVETLLLLVQNAGRLMEKDDLMRRVWPSTFVEEGNLNKNIFTLRKTLGQWDGGLEYIETVPKRGYRFVAPVNLQRETDSKPQIATGIVSNFEETAAKAALNATSRLRSPIVSEHSPEGTIRGKEKEHGAPSIPPNQETVSSKRESRAMRVAAVAIFVGLLAAVVPFARLISGSTSFPKVSESRALTNDGLAKFSLESDGARLYFVEQVGEKEFLTQISTEGGEPARMEIPFQDPWIYDISPDRSKLLLGGNFREKAKELWVVPVPAGSPYRIGDLLGTGAVWSPDGTHIAFTRQHNLYTARIDGTEVRIVGTMSGFVVTPRFSPEGGRLRFTMYDPVKNLVSVWEIGLDGQHLHRVAPDASGAIRSSSWCCGRWSTDGRYFFYLTWLINQRMGQDIWVSGEHLGIFRQPQRPERLTSGPLGFDSITPAIDGKRLFAIGSQARVELEHYDSSSKSFQPFLGGISAGDVDISRDGQWATYVAYPDLTLWRSRVDGSERLQLTFAPGEAFLPRWSPDGRRIVFTDLRPGIRNRIFIVPRDGGLPEPLIPDDQYNEIDPTWSSDGKSIVFARTHQDPDLAIYEIDLQTHQLRMVPGSKELTSPRMSPDGHYLCALSRDWTSLLIFDTESEKWQQMKKVEGPVGIGYPNWSHDGTWIYYRVGHDIVRLRIADRRTEPVVDLTSIAQPSPTWLGLAADDSVLIQRDRSLHDVYVLDLLRPE